MAGFDEVPRAVRVPKRRGLAVAACVAGVVIATGVGVLWSSDDDGPGLAATRDQRPTTTSAATSTTPPTSDPTTTAPTIAPDTTPPPTSSPTSTSTVRPVPASSGVCAPVGSLTVAQLAHLVVMARIEGTSIDQARMLVGGTTPLGGLFIGGDDDHLFTDGSLAALQRSTHALVAVDDEGGRVQRIEQLVGQMPTAAAMGSMTPDAVRALAVRRGQALRTAGVTVDFAPVVDLAAASTTQVIGDRSFGTDVDGVVARARAFADGLRAAGVIPTFKHFPGHGSASGDSHKAAVTAPPLAELAQRDLVPYRILAGPGAPSSWVMVGHLDVPGLTEPGRPASLSPAAYRYLRQTIGFDGLAVTDELGGMRAVRSRYQPSQAAVLAIGAGADLTLFGDPAQADPAARAIAAAVQDGTLPQARLVEAATRVRGAQGC